MNGSIEIHSNIYVSNKKLKSIIMNLKSIQDMKNLIAKDLSKRRKNSKQWMTQNLKIPSKFTHLNV